MQPQKRAITAAYARPVPLLRAGDGAVSGRTSRRVTGGPLLACPRPLAAPLKPLRRCAACCCGPWLPPLPSASSQPHPPLRFAFTSSPAHPLGHTFPSQRRGRPTQQNHTSVGAPLRLAGRLCPAAGQPDKVTRQADRPNCRQEEWDMVSRTGSGLLCCT